MESLVDDLKNLPSQKKVNAISKILAEMKKHSTYNLKISKKLFLELFIHLSQDSTTNQSDTAKILDIMHTKLSPAFVSKQYISAASKQGISRQILDQYYQSFLRVLRKNKTDTSSFPKSIFIINQGMKGNLDNPLELGIDWVKHWESAYNGVSQIWDILQSQPDLVLDQYFDDMSLAQKLYLLEGIETFALESDDPERYTPFLEKHIGLLKTKDLDLSVSQLNDQMSSIIEQGTPSRFL